MLTNPDFQAMSRFSKACHCSFSKFRDVARIICRLRAVCDNFPHTSPARITNRNGFKNTVALMDDCTNRQWPISPHHLGPPGGPLLFRNKGGSVQHSGKPAMQASEVEFCTRVQMEVFLLSNLLGQLT